MKFTFAELMTIYEMAKDKFESAKSNYEWYEGREKEHQTETGEVGYYQREMDNAATEMNRYGVLVEKISKLTF